MGVTTRPDQPGTSAECADARSILTGIGDKWTILTLSMLAEQPRRFNELKRLIGGISQQMLTRTLKALERDGLVARKVHPTVPPQVEYSLTAMGESLSEPLMQLAQWVLDHMGDVARHRAWYDEERKGAA